MSPLGERTGWRWTREPAECSEAGAGGLRWRCSPTSDFWRHTASGAVNHDGNAYLVPVNGDFVMEGRFSAAFEGRYDQVGFMAWVGEDRWVKAGGELDGGLLVGAVNTDGASDWSMAPGAMPLSIRMQRRAGTLEIHERAGSRGWRMIRQLTMEGDVHAGPYACSPLGHGFESELTEFILEDVS